MKLEYLFKETAPKDELKKYKHEKVTVSISENIGESDCWILTCCCKGENEDSAKILSSVNEDIKKKYDVTVLTNESSAYFNKTLYPLVNVFERKLRKLLYIKVALNIDDKRIEKIKNLEDMDLGKIFTIIFSDINFVSQIKNKINKEMTWEFTKFELIKEVENINEDVLWNHLLDDKKQTDLPNKYLEVKQYRNDVMHAHNINYETYSIAKKLFNKINEQIDNAIGQNRPDKEFNDAFDNALKNSSLVSELNNTQRIDDYKYKINNDSHLEEIDKLHSIMNNSTAIADLGKIRSILNTSPVLREVDKIHSIMNNSPAIADLGKKQSTLYTSPVLRAVDKIHSIMDNSPVIANLEKIQPVIDINKTDNKIISDIHCSDISEEEIEKKIVEDYLEEEHNEQNENGNA